MRTNETICVITGLKIDVVIEDHEEFVANSLTPQFDSVQVINLLQIINK
jgi:hypothetical protein